VVYEISRSGQSRNHLTYDLADLSQIDSLIETLGVRIKSKSVDEILFVNNAAQLGPIKRSARINQSDILQSVNTNITTPLLLIQGFVRFLRDAPIPKTIIHIGSGAAKKGYAGWTLYCAGKAALDNYLAALYEEEKDEPLPFRVLNVNPSVMDTSMQSQIRQTPATEFPSLERFTKLHEEGHLLSPEQVATAIISQLNKSNNHDLHFDVRSYLDPI